MVFILELTCLPASGIDRIYLVSIGLTDMVGQIGVVLINKVERAATGFLLMESTDIIIVFLCQILIFQVFFKMVFRFFLGNVPFSRRI